MFSSFTKTKHLRCFFVCCFACIHNLFWDVVLFVSQFSTYSCLCTQPPSLLWSFILHIWNCELCEYFMFSRMFRFQFLSLSIYILVTLWMVHVMHYFSKLVWHQVVWKRYQFPEGWKEKEPAVYKNKYNTRCSFHQNDKPFKGDPIEDSRETCTKFGKWLNIQICPFADFKWFFWQYLCNKSSFCFEFSILVHSTKKEKKRVGSWL